MAEIESLSAKHSIAEGVSRVLDRLAGIALDAAGERPLDYEGLERDLNLADQLLISELRQIVPGNLSAEWEQEAKTELKIYRKKLPKETYSKILDNYLAARLRHFFGVGEMSLLVIE